jgi:hypothetical protein
MSTQSFDGYFAGIYVPDCRQSETHQKLSLSAGSGKEESKNQKCGSQEQSGHLERQMMTG